MCDEVQSISKHLCIKKGIYCLVTARVDTLLPPLILHPGQYELACLCAYMVDKMTGGILLCNRECGEEVWGGGEAEVKELGNGRR